MTVLVGLVQPDGSVLIGADACSSGEHSAIQNTDAKTFAVDGGRVLFASSGRIRTLQALKHGLFSPPNPADDPMREMVRWATAFRVYCRDAGMLEKSDDQLDGAVLVGYAGRLFCVMSDFAVIERTTRYAAVGCGMEWAEAVLHVFEHLHAYVLSPRELLTLALETAAHFDIHCRAPFTIIEGGRALR